MCLGLFICSLLHAVPAKRGLWKHITLADGTQVMAEMRGDEHGKFWVDREGHAYLMDKNGSFQQMTMQEATAKLALYRQQSEDIHASKGMKAPRRVNGIPTDKSIFQGKKKGIVILVQFPEGTYTENSETIVDPAVSFSEDTPALLGCTTTRELYQKIINQRHLKDDPMRGPFMGSVKDYFIDQSFGQFELDFDIVGPFTLSKCRHYYGKNKEGGSDSHAGEMVYEAVNLAIANGVDFSQYDWNGDYVIDQVFVLYAGQGEADGGDHDCIWPHEYYLNYAYRSITTNINGKNYTINQYACSNELATNKHYGKTEDEDFVYGTQINGIGTLCHEFSHCMGYPDMYDIAYVNYGMSSWDLMDSGSYNGKWNGGHSDWPEMNAGYEPAGYTAFERWCAGWIEPIVLSDPQKITNMKPMGGTQEGGIDDHGDAYVIYMPGSKKTIEGEYYMLENRQQANWDTSLPWHGLLITYVHYNQSLWRNNCLNCTDPATLRERGASNDHPRITVFQAGGDDPGFLSLDAYPYKTQSVYDIIGSGWGNTARQVINNLNRTYGSKGLSLSAEDCDELSAFTYPTSLYWGNNSSEQVLLDHDIWKIESSDANEEDINFIYRRLANERVLNLDQDTEEPQSWEKGFYSSATMNRELTPGIYNTLWLPFDMSRTEIISTWGEGTEIYRLTDVFPDENGKLIINLDEDTKNGIKAYEPIFIKLDEEAENTAMQINQYIQVNEDYDVDREPIVELQNGWKLVGTKNYGYVPADAKYLKDNYYYTAGNNKTIIRAYRAYFVAPADVNDMFSSSKDVVYNVKRYGLDEQTTSITHTKETSSIEKDGIYDLFGRKLDSSNLPSKGIYIKNGKKYIVR